MVFLPFYLSIILGIPSIFYIDLPVHNYLNTHNPYKEEIAYLGSCGDKYIILPTTISFYGYSYFTGNYKDLSYQLFYSSVLSFTATSLMKFIIGRERPEYGNHLSFNPFSFDDRFFSMPSGHAAISMSLGMSFFYSTDNTIYKSLSLAIPLITGFSRIYTEKHYLSDVLIGWGIGYVSATIVNMIIKKEEK